MTPSSSPIDNARAAIRGVLAGNPPNGTRPEDCGEWCEAVRGVFDGWKDGKTEGARHIWGVLSRGRPELQRLVAEDPAREPIRERAALMPELPADAQDVYRHLEPCGQWLEEYVAYAMHAAPMTPRNFHEAAGLFAASMAVARRLVCVHGAHRTYPNLYFLFVSPSTVDHKSTGKDVLQAVIHGAGLAHLLMPRKATPQALVHDLDYAKLPKPRQLLDLDAFLLRRAFAAQRGWLRDEASALFASLKQEFNSGLLELILELYDCPEYYDDLTISRDETRIDRAYLSFFGLSTPVEMAPHFANLGYWSNGLWARCLVLTPDDSERPFQFFPQTVPNDGTVIGGLNRMYHLFPQPRAELDSVEVRDSKPEQVIRLLNMSPPAVVRLAPGVWEAWEAYSKATTHTLLHAKAVEEELFSSYGRFGTLSMKIAMLLAVMDACEPTITIELRHYAAAQQRVEAWRAGLHRLWSSQSATNETRLMERIDKKLKQAGASGITVRELCISLHQSSKEIGEALMLLSKSGKASASTMRAANGRAVEVWSCQ
jgi:Protein of unknown function (DUF3987)